MMELRMLWARLGETFAQLTQVSTPEQPAAARRPLKTTRRSVFAILAEGRDEEEEEQ
ncbi:hypothetical protein AB0M95_04905 [Sphaerisporangium sp. NPDC051017]|uniref:hypothetical protein n=1 Tax=unclassified Sphaerisporangium TaxID=2630420 RepID=UPI0033F5BDA9